MTKNLKYIALCLFVTLLAIACSKDGADGNDVSKPNEQTPEEITLNPTIWQMIEGTRATTYDAGTPTSSSFTAAAYVGNTTTAYISPVTVNWATDKWEWSDGKHYWPASGNLDFFAYMLPSTTPSYITAGPTYLVESSTPQASFTCANLPMSYDAAAPTAGQGSNLQEFVWGITVGQNKANQGASGVTMKFRRPFARIRFQLSASHPNVQINTITFKALKTGGICTLNNTDIESSYYYKTCVWSSLTGSSDLVMTLASKDDDDNWIAANVNTFNSNPSTVVPIGGYSDDAHAHQYVDLLVVPQTFAGVIVVNATWTDWGAQLAHTVSTTLPSSVTWQSGCNYTYTFTITETDLKVNSEKYTEQW